MSKYAVFFTSRARPSPGHGAAKRPGPGGVEGGGIRRGHAGGLVDVRPVRRFVIVDLPDSWAAAATSLAVSSTGTVEHLETHELIEAEELNPILERAKGITTQLPGTYSQPWLHTTDPVSLNGPSSLAVRQGRWQGADRFGTA
jgi:hypothetical protein